MCDLQFNMKYKDFELKACPKRLARFGSDEPNETIDFVKWFQNGDHKSCYSIAYFLHNKDDYWELRFVANRFFEDVEKEDYTIIMTMLKAAYEMLNGEVEE